MNVQRIFCIGRNYAEHIRELGNTPDDAFLVFMKPASSIVPVGSAIPLPRGRGAVHHETELVVQLGRGGADIPEAEATRHVSALTLGLDLTLRELQGELKKKGSPWELAKAFDHSAPLGNWTAYSGQPLQDLRFSCDVNGQRRQDGHTRDMLFGVARIIHILSRTWALQAGDVIYTGTPAGVGPIAPGDRIVLEGAGLGRHEWRCA
ncbi:MAG TPA: fumarylacetoacetate hydrolase family protein [Verrucomicrobiae bacterium]|nr:fumarylacetoacetate hydrolase family protein [Verrucomicrobiae bacterium]